MALERLVSIITPVYNNELTLQATLESVKTQSYQDWEMLCIFDSGTTDHSRDIVRRFSRLDPRIHLLELHDNRGCGAARNFGLQKAQGRWIAFLDADDVWLPEKLQRQIDFMQKEQSAFSCTGYRKINSDGLTQSGPFHVPKKVRYKDLLKNNTVCCPSVVIDRSLTGPFKMTPRARAEDLILWLEITKRGFTCDGLDEVFVLYRISNTSRSSSRIKSIRARWEVYRNFENLNWFRSFFYFLHYILTAIRKNV